MLALRVLLPAVLALGCRGCCFCRCCCGCCCCCDPCPGWHSSACAPSWQSAGAGAACAGRLLHAGGPAACWSAAGAPHAAGACLVRWASSHAARTRGAQTPTGAAAGTLVRCGIDLFNAHMQICIVLGYCYGWLCALCSVQRMPCNVLQHPMLLALATGGRPRGSSLPAGHAVTKEEAVPAWLWHDWVGCSAGCLASPAAAMLLL